jgi:Dolichyl-phosphate-mannose-protein mannosyltransferase
MDVHNRVFWIVVFALFLLTRIPVRSRYLSIDNVNLAFALEKFDPRAHQPQPPGYPLFVLFNRAVNAVFHDAEKTFAFTGLLASALCLPVVCVVGTRMFAPWVGRASALLLLLVPPFWYGSLEGPLRPYLALFSLLTAYGCWRCWNGEKSYAIWSAVVLGIGAGFRPDLGGYLFPLWLLSAWMGTRSAASVIKGLAVMAAVVFAWLGGTAYVVGGFVELYRLNVNYVAYQSVGQTVARQISRLIIWNGTAVLGALWALPVVFKVRERANVLTAQTIFIITWLLPGLLFQGFVHVEDPGHTLFSVPPLCIVAAFLIFAATERMTQMREVFLAGALVLHTMLFLGLFSLPAAGAPAGGWHSLQNAFMFGTFETSIGELRYLDNTALKTMAELHQFERKDVPTIIVSSDVDTVNWFMNWRIMRYYAPNLDIWVLGDAAAPRFVRHVRRDRTLEMTSTAPLQVPVPRQGRIIWLLEREGPFHRALKQFVPALEDGEDLSYTDMTADAQPFSVMGFDFIPSEH